MGVNHVQLGNGETVVDLRGITVNEDVLFEGYTAIDSKGNPVTGKASSQGGGETVQEIFYAHMTYDDGDVSLNDVSYEDILTAYTNDKRIIAVVDGLYGKVSLPMSRLNNSVFIFNVTMGSNSIALNVYDDDTASINETDLQRTSRLTKSISASSTDAQYPSAKAVYNYVQENAGGGGTAVQEIAYVYGTFEMATMSYSTDTTFEEIMSMVDNGKYVVAKSTITFGGTPTNITWMPITAIDPSYVAVFEGTMQADLSALNPAYKLVLLAISVEICPDGIIHTRVRVVSTTNLN